MAEQIVYDFTQFRSAILAADIDTVKLGADIEYTSVGGVSVPRTKTELTIDGQGFTITDRNSAAGSDAINIAVLSGADLTITIKNAVWIGRNYYGVVYIPDSTYTSNITLVFENVQYSGVQAVFHRHGTTRFVDSSFTIEMQGTASSVNEVGEFNKVVCEGNVSFESFVALGIYSMFWFPHAGSSFSVVDNANVFIKSNYNYIFYSDVAFPMSFGQNSKVEIHSERGLFLYAGASGHMASSFVMERGATFEAFTKRTSSTIPILKCNNEFRMEEDSVFYLETQESGTGASLFFASVANITFNNPKSVVIYNNGGNAFSFNGGTSASPNNILLKAEQINYWTSATAFPSAGNFEDTPTRRFTRQDGSNIEASLTVLPNNTTTVVSTNIAAGDEGYPMTAATFPIATAKVLSFGNIVIDLDEVSDISTRIEGTTEPNANIRAIYNTTTLNDISLSDGTIAMTIPSPIPVDTVITFGSNWRFLTKFIEVTVVGSVSITYLPDLIFKAFVAPYGRDIVERVDPDWYMEVTDTRTTGNLCDWYLYAALPEPLSTPTDTLDDALILRETTDTTMSPQYVLIKQGSWSSPAPIITRVTWEQAKGFLLSIIRGFAYNAGEYSSHLSWTVQTEPLDLD